MIQTQFEVLPNGNLRLFCDKETQNELQRIFEEDHEQFNSGDMENEVLEHVTANGLCSTSSDFTGDLTSAPMLCETISDHGWPEGKYWAFMDYQVRLVQDDLREQGECIWESGGEMPPYDRTHFPGKSGHTFCGLEIMEYTNPLRDKVTPRVSFKVINVDCYKCEELHEQTA